MRHESVDRASVRRGHLRGLTGVCWDPQRKGDAEKYLGEILAEHSLNWMETRDAQIPNPPLTASTTENEGDATEGHDGHVV